ncbi:MAG: hypothetical protein LBP86_03980 [Azoarcus sp.]|jgi:diaminopimelate decarboxylase|nr:hypothetical protein [Azoarcus sp.]
MNPMPIDTPLDTPLSRVADHLSAHKLQTPCYVYDVGRCVRDGKALVEALGGPLVVSLKANPNVDLCMRIRHLQGGIEVASLKELHTVSKADNVFVNSPVLDRSLIRVALSVRATFIIDNPGQLDDILDLQGTRPAVRIMLRLNAQAILSHFLGPDGMPSLRGDHFGLDWPGAMALVDKVKEHPGRLQCLGFHLFAGSHAFPRVGMQIAELAPVMVAAMEARHGAEITVINLGGGFSEVWQSGNFDFAAYRERLAALPGRITVYHESGRGLFAGCGVFASTVIRTKIVAGRHYAVCDGGLAQGFLLCQTENPFRKLRHPRVVRTASAAATAPDVHTLLVGPSCSRDDVIGEVTGAPLAPGDICLFDNCGAYHSTYTPSGFLGLEEARQYVLG